MSALSCSLRVWTFAALIGVTSANATSLEEWVSTASTESPTLAASRAEQLARSHTAAVSGAWSDPIVMVEYSNVPVSNPLISAHPMAGVQLKVQQQIQWPGWRHAQQAAASAKVDQSEQLTERATQALAASLRHTWWSITESRLLRAVTEQHLARTVELLAAATARYEVGASGQSNMLRLEVLHGRLEDELEGFDTTNAVLQAAFARAVGQRQEVTLDTLPALDALPPEDLEAQREQALTRHPLLAQYTAETELQQAMAKQAQLRARPSPTVWAGYRLRTAQTETDSGRDLVSAGFSVPIPAGSGRRAAADHDAALARAQGAQSQHQATVDEMDAGLLIVEARWQRAHQKTLHYSDVLIPVARSALEATLNEYSVGKADFSSLFSEEVSLLELERARIRAVVQTHRAYTDAQVLLGARVSGGQP